MESKITATIQRFCLALDQKNWTQLAHCLTETIYTDYSSFRQTPPATISSKEYAMLREQALSHLITIHENFDFQVEINNSEAQCYCKYRIQRFTADRSKFFHSYGTYHYTLTKEQGDWRISAIRQFLRKNEGDPSIHGGLR